MRNISTSLADVTSAQYNVPEIIQSARSLHGPSSLLVIKQTQLTVQLPEIKHQSPLARGTGLNA